MSKILDAISIAFEEAVRFQEELACNNFDVLKQNTMDAFWTLPAEGGTGALICGQSAGQALFDALSLRVSEGPYAGRLDLKKLYTRYTSEIVTLFISERKELSEEQEKIAFARALQTSVEDLKDRTHLLPCHLVMAKSPDSVRLGPVLFRRRELHWPKVKKSLRFYYQKRRTKTTIDIESIEEYYNSFNWYAEVEVEGCEAAPSKEIATRMAWSAIDCLQLLIGGEGLERMSVGDVACARNGQAHLTFCDNEIENLTLTLTGQDLPLGDEVWRQTSSPNVLCTLDLMGLAIANTHNSNKACELSERFIDAVHWYGLAMRDPNPSTRLVSLIMAVERLLLPRRVEAIESTVKFRSRPFVNWTKHGKRVKKLYGIRGTLAHGRMSARAPELYSACRDANIFANSVLFECLHVFGNEGLMQSGVTVDQIESAFEKHAKRFQSEQKQKSNYLARW